MVKERKPKSGKIKIVKEEDLQEQALLGDVPEVECFPAVYETVEAEIVQEPVIFDTYFICECGYSDFAQIDGQTTCPDCKKSIPEAKEINCGQCLS